MADMDDLKNTAKDAKGRAEEAAGAVTGDKELKAEGKADQLKADAAKAFDKVKDEAEEAGKKVEEGAKKLGEEIRGAFKK